VTKNERKENDHILFIKNMVCLRCMKTINRIMHDADINVKSIQLGEVQIEDEIDEQQKKDLIKLLQEEGFELLDDKTSRTVSKIKDLIVEEIHMEKGKRPESMNFSEFLSKEIGYEYSYLSKLFSSVAGMTIEKFVIAQKIERAKELLSYEELSVSEIAWRLGYSSSQHLSNQFRNVTGISPLDFRNSHNHDRKHIDHV